MPFDPKLRSAEELPEHEGEAHREAERTHELIQRRTVNDTGELSEPLMIPRDGAISLLRNDPLIQGPKLFQRHCASCHAYEGPAGKDES